MSLPREPKMPKLESIIIDEYNKFLFEIFDKPYETDYKIIKNKKFGNISYDVYRFKTKSNTSYDVDFYEILFKSDSVGLVDDSLLSDHLNSPIILGIDVGFTTTDVNRITASDDEYRKRTNKNEQYEVLGKVAFMVKEYINSHPDIFCYILGKNTSELNLLAYRKMFENIFSSDFEMFEGDSIYHESGAYYFIKK